MSCTREFCNTAYTTQAFYAIQWLSVTEREGKLFSHLQFMTESVPSFQIVTLIKRHTTADGGGRAHPSPTSNFAL